jgi:hypothetical protein
MIINNAMSVGQHCMSTKFSCFLWLHTDVPELYVPVLAAAVDPAILWILSAVDVQFIT